MAIIQNVVKFMNLTYIPKSVPPICAAWSKNSHRKMIPNASSNRMLLSAVYDENVKNGRNMIINWISGRSRQVAPNTPNMAPLYLKKINEN
mgnify:CR=1 FL=1